MKNIKSKLISSALLVASVFGFSSCGDFLTIEPKTFISEDNFWNEKSDIDQMVAGVYVAMQDRQVMDRMIVYGEMRSDNITGGLDYTKNTSLYRILKEDLLSDNPYTIWTSLYSVINRCNVLITRAPEVHEKDPAYTMGNVKATIAECSFLRDLCYFYLVRAFKDVPYYTTAIQSDNDIPELPAADGDSIVRVLIQDLESVVDDALVAYPKDLSSQYNSNCNRVTRSAIYALLADLCLWDGQYGKCNDYCQRVIERKRLEYNEDYSKQVNMSSSSPVLFSYTKGDYVSENYPLYPCYYGDTYGNSYDAIFGSENSFESIFELNFSYNGAGSDAQNTALGYFYGEHTSSNDSNHGHGILGVDDGILTQQVQKNYYPSGLYMNGRDVRFFTDIYPDDDYTKGYIAKGGSKSMAMVTLATGSSTFPYQTGFVLSNYQNRNWIFYRLTDVMLMQAEALFFMGGEENLQKAYSLVWIVNRRSVMVNNTSPSQYDLDKAGITENELSEDIILTERQRELMFEGKRWFDILRKCHRDKSPAYAQRECPAKIAAGGGAKLFTNYEALFWPYNRKEVINNQNLKQKPYYGDDQEGSSNLNY